MERASFSTGVYYAVARWNTIVPESGQGLTPRGRTLASNGRDSTSTNGPRDKWPEDDLMSAGRVVSSKDRQANIELTGLLFAISLQLARSSTFLRAKKV